MSLYNGEKLNFENNIEVNDQLTDEMINEKYLLGEFRIVTEQGRYPLDTISSQIVNNPKIYKLNPEFQRRHRWDNKKRSALIESLIINIPIPPIFLYEHKFSEYEVMDGLQRLTAIAGFYDNEFALEGLQYWPELNGKKYSELPENIQKGIDRRYISSIILLNETAKTHEKAQFMKKLVFDRLNSGGVALNAQEKRNANYDGDFNRFCIELASNNYFRKLWGIIIDATDEGNDDIEIFDIDNKINKIYKEMMDVELTLRFFAYRQRKELQSGYTLEQYLDLYLDHANKTIQHSTLEELKKLFLQTMELTWELLGERAFWMYRKRKESWNWLQRPTVVVFEPITYVLSNLLDNKHKLLSQKEEISDALSDFYIENYEIFEGRNTGVSDLVKRQTAFEDFFNRFI